MTGLTPPQSAPPRRKAALILKIVAVLIGVFLVVPGVFVYSMLSGSKPTLDGSVAAPGLGASVKISRDSLGIPTIEASTRADLAYGTGFVHAQDRFFQMDLSRRLAAGELSQIFGAVALEQDRKARLFRFRSVAQTVLTQMPAEERALVTAYTRGVNAGLAKLRTRPWEYIALQVTPVQWREEDVVLVSYAMWWDLQYNGLRREQARHALNMRLGGPECAGGWKCVLEFFYPRGTSWDSPNSATGNVAPSVVHVPTPEELNLRDGAAASGAATPPAVAPGTAAAGAAAAGIANTGASVSPATTLFSQVFERQPVVGSNGWVVGGAIAQGGGALVASDMHLGLRVPTVWYRARLQVKPAGASDPTLDLNGLTLPGAHVLVAGSNTRIAWGFTNSYGDWTDVTFAPCTEVKDTSMQTADGRTIPLTTVQESIVVKGAKRDSPLAVMTGPDGVLFDADPTTHRCWFARWIATVPAATNFDLRRVEDAASVAQVVEMAPTLGIPHQNMMLGDRDGHIAWTIAGRIPDTTDAKLRLTGTAPWTTAANHPRVVDPPEHRVWTANARSVDDPVAEALVAGDEAALGSEYDLGARAKQIHDDLAALKFPAKPADMLAVQLDDRALFLQRWHDLLIQQLDNDAVRNSPQRAELKKLVTGWNARATTDSVGYRLVRAYHTQVESAAWNMVLEGIHWDGAVPPPPAQFEGALWEMVSQQPLHLLAKRFPDWHTFLLEQADNTIKTLTDSSSSTGARAACSSLAACTWQTHNPVRVRHPMSAGLPLFASFLNMPEIEVPGDHDMPRVQDGAFGASERFAVVPGRESEGYLHIAGGQSGHPMSPYYKAGYREWAEGKALPFLPGAAEHVLTLDPVPDPAP